MKGSTKHEKDLEKRISMTSGLRLPKNFCRSGSAGALMWSFFRLDTIFTRRIVNIISLQQAEDIAQLNAQLETVLHRQGKRGLELSISVVVREKEHVASLLPRLVALGAEQCLTSSWSISCWFPTASLLKLAENDLVKFVKLNEKPVLHQGSDGIMEKVRVPSILPRTGNKYSATTKIPFLTETSTTTKTPLPTEMVTVSQISSFSTPSKVARTLAKGLWTDHSEIVSEPRNTPVPLSAHPGKTTINAVKQGAEEEIEIQEMKLPSATFDEVVWEMLSYAAFEPNLDVVKAHPMLKRYAEDFGRRKGDMGVVAVLSKGAQRSGKKYVGAAWIRLALKESERGFAYLQSDIPELAIAVLPEYRGQRVGAKLLDALLSAAKESGFPGVTLSCRKDNQPARGLYENRGFKSVGKVRIDNSLLMGTLHSERLSFS
eukprot:g52839.t1